MLKQGYNAADGAFRLAISLQRKRPVDFLLLKPQEGYNFSRYKNHYGRESLMRMRNHDELQKTACKADPYDMCAFRSSVNNQIQFTMMLSYLIPVLAEKTLQDDKIDAQTFNRYVSNLKRAAYWEPLPFDDYEGTKYAKRWMENIKGEYTNAPELWLFRAKLRENVTALNHLANKFYYYQNDNDVEKMRKFAEENNLPSVIYSPFGKSLLEGAGRNRTQVFHILRHATYFLGKIL